jgi:hypothetical protein
MTKPDPDSRYLCWSAFHCLCADNAQDNTEAGYTERDTQWPRWQTHYVCGTGIESDNFWWEAAHTLSARHLIDDLVEDRATLPETINSANADDIRRAAVVHLGRQYQLASRYTSFVAVFDETKVLPPSNSDEEASGSESHPGSPTEFARHFTDNTAESDASVTSERSEDEGSDGDMAEGWEPDTRRLEEADVVETQPRDGRMEETRQEQERQQSDGRRKEATQRQEAERWKQLKEAWGAEQTVSIALDRLAGTEKQGDMVQIRHRDERRPLGIEGQHLMADEVRRLGPRRQVANEPHRNNTT